MTAVFWGTFAATRGLAIILAIIAAPGLVMWGSYGLCLLGSVLLSVFANQNWQVTLETSEQYTCSMFYVLCSITEINDYQVLYAGTAMMGVGMASIFATGFLWVEQRITITSKVRRSTY